MRNFFKYLFTAVVSYWLINRLAKENKAKDNNAYDLLLDRWETMFYVNKNNVAVLVDNGSEVIN